MIIIGGGLAGLATGCYAQMNGYRTRILEMHELPGGCCTSWDQGRFTFDWCVSWLLGSGPGNDMYQIWLELGALQGKQMRNFETFNNVRGRDGRTVYFYSDPDRLEAHLLEHSPADAKLIHEFCSGVRTFKKLLNAYPFLKPPGLMGRVERWRMLAVFLPHWNTVRKALTTLMTDYSARFKDPLLREAFNFILYERHPAFPLLPFYFQLGAHAGLTAGVPEGGSLELARSIERRYQRLGGEISYNAKVEEVLVDDDQAVGVRLSDKREYHADIVVAACDGHTAVTRMLKGRYLNETYRRLYEETIDEPGQTYPGYVSAFFALNRPFPDEDPCTTHLLTGEEAAGLVGMGPHPSVNVQFRSQHYPEHSPVQTSVIFVTYFSDTAAWRKLADGPEQASRVRQGTELHTLRVRRGRAYYMAKRQIRESLIQLLDRRFPGFADSIVTYDISTPLTQIRYTANYDGSIAGWLPFVDAGETMEQEMERNGPVLPGLSNFYLSGVWTTIGGLIRAVASGRHVVQFICRDDGRPFTATIDESAPPPTQIVVSAPDRTTGARPTLPHPPRSLT